MYGQKGVRFNSNKFLLTLFFLTMGISTKSFPFLRLEIKKFFTGHTCTRPGLLSSLNLKFTEPLPPLPEYDIVIYSK